MELLTFHDRIYGKYNQNLYTFEPTWDSFRPIAGIAWDGKQFVPIELYKTNIFDEHYGYGSLVEKALCRKLTQETELSETKEIKDPVFMWRWYGEKNVKWWHDRPCVFLPCVSKEKESWRQYLKYLETRAKTLRRPFKGRATKRLLPK
jgi:hypothetical protein